MVANTVFLGGSLQQYSYEAPHRIHTAKVYPLTASNGSIVIVYGHENGLRFVWRPPGSSEERKEDAESTFASALHMVDVHLGGAEALSIDFPKLPANLNVETASIPTLLSERILVGVACSDYSIRVVTLPIDLTENEIRSEQVISLVGEPSHESIPTCVSVTFTPRQFSTDSTVDIEDDSHQSRRQDSEDWDFLIASASPDLSGHLLIHRVPCNKAGLDGSAKYCIPWKVHRLVSPAVSLSFSSAVYPSSHHLQLLIAETPGVVRIEDYLSDAYNPRLIRSLYTEFGFRGDLGSPRPNRILDCRWLLEGKAIIVLLTSGEWGIWDPENAGPRATEVKSRTHASAGGSLFAINGWVQTKTSKSSTTLGDTKAATSKYAPMTPSTRKTRQAALFTSDSQQSSAPSRGGISVVTSPSISSRRADDSSILLWHGTTIISIPSIVTYWQNRLRGSGKLFETSSESELKIISNVRFSGEACSEVSLNPCSPEVELVISAGRRLIVIDSTETQDRRSSGTSQSKVVSTDDQLFASGELDLFGMDRVLESMSNGHSLEGSSTEQKKKWIKTR